MQLLICVKAGARWYWRRAYILYDSLRPVDTAPYSSNVLTKKISSVCINHPTSMSEIHFAGLNDVSGHTARASGRSHTAHMSF